MKLTRVRLTRVIATIFLIALVAVLWLFLLQPRQADIESTRSDISDAQMMQQALVARDAELRSLLGDAPLVAREAQELFAALPRTAQLPELLDQITTAAINAGIPASDISVINTSIPTPISEADPRTAALAEELGVDLAVIDIDLSVTGNDDEFLGFLTNLTSLERAFLVQSTSLATSRDNTGNQTLSIAGRLFVLQSSLPDLVATVDELLAEAEQEATRE